MFVGSRKLLGLAQLLLAGSAFAGGSVELVAVSSFERVDATKYILEVKPQLRESTYVDPYMGDCDIFRVHGEFRNPWRLFRGRPFSEGVDVVSHKRAMSYLERAVGADTLVSLGWIGGGFRPLDPEKPCSVASRALRIYVDQDGNKHVVSYHDPY